MMTLKRYFDKGDKMSYKNHNHKYNLFKCPHCGMLLKNTHTNKDTTGVCLACQTKISISSNEKIDNIITPIT